MLVDSATITVRSGKGGAGMVSFRREKFVPKGGPNGGDGGDGGSVVLVAWPKVETLLDFAGRHHWYAEDGKPGMPSDKAGKRGADLEVHLPPGTQVYAGQSQQLLIDLDEPGKRYVVAEGGRGGRGNARFATPTQQAPRYAEPGDDGYETPLRLELKLIADVGLVGKPNAGKSTLLSRISRARPKIAGYPFTTLAPNLGIAEVPGRGGDAFNPRRLVVADIPGLIDHAHEGAGLGIQFLRHVERTRLLVHLLELEPMDNSDPIENYHTIRRELEAYSPQLASKPEIVALSKIELAGDQADRHTAVEMIRGELDKPVLAISAVTGDGLDDLMQTCRDHLEQAQTAWSAEAPTWPQTT